MEKNYFVYIMASLQNKVLYVGITNDLARRVYEHKEGLVEGFTKKYHVKKLIYFECFNDVQEAIRREKCLKRWKREWKEDLVNSMNAEWKDLYQSI